MNNLLVLPNQHTKEDQIVWREAIRRGWKTLRFDPNQPEKIEGYDVVRYYGNVLHRNRIRKYLPIRFREICPTALSELHQSWTRRKILSMKYSELPNPLPEDLFVKCAEEKWIEAKIYPKGTDHRTAWSGIMPNDLIYVQEPVEFKHELRCFVINREVVTASWYRKNKVFCPEFVPLNNKNNGIAVPVFDTYSLIWVMENHVSTLPTGVVIDWGLSGGAWSVIEFNEAWASGTYDSDPEKVFDTIIASQDNAPC